MLLYGTTLNVVAAFIGLALLARDASTALAMAVYFAPVPYNVFLLAALWRSAAAADEPWASSARVTGLFWFFAMMII